MSAGLVLPKMCSSSGVSTASIPGLKPILASRAISDDTSSVAYLPDHIVSPGVSDQVRDLINDVDVLLHDAQFVESERAYADAYAHSTVDDAVALATECGVRKLVLFHHGPARTDEANDAIAAGLDPSGTVVLAVQGDEIDVRHS